MVITAPLLFGVVSLGAAACDKPETSAPLRIGENVSKVAELGTPYKVQLSLEGGPATFRVCNSPAPYEVSPEGEVSWNPVDPATQKFCVRALRSGAQTRLEWEVTATWPKGQSPSELQALVDAWRQRLKAVLDQPKQSPRVCPSDGVAAIQAALPVVNAGALEAPSGEAKPKILNEWRPMGLGGGPSMTAATVKALLAQRYVLAVVAQRYVEPTLLLNMRFQKGEFAGALKLVDTETKAVVCETQLSFESSPEVVSHGGIGGPSDPTRKDFLQVGTRALGAASKRLAPNLTPDLPFLPQTMTDELSPTAR